MAKVNGFYKFNVIFRGCKFEATLVTGDELFDPEWTIDFPEELSDDDKDYVDSYLAAYNDDLDCDEIYIDTPHLSYKKILAEMLEHEEIRFRVMSEDGEECQPTRDIEELVAICENIDFAQIAVYKGILYKCSISLGEYSEEIGDIEISDFHQSLGAYSKTLKAENEELERIAGGAR